MALSGLVLLCVAFGHSTCDPGHLTFSSFCSSSMVYGKQVKELKRRSEETLVWF